jgi:hypothetical protein
MDSPDGLDKEPETALADTVEHPLDLLSNTVKEQAPAPVDPAKRTAILLFPPVKDRLSEKQYNIALGPRFVRGVDCLLTVSVREDLGAVIFESYRGALVPRRLSTHLFVRLGRANEHCAASNTHGIDKPYRMRLIVFFRA